MNCEILDRRPPADLDAEKGVVGSLLLDPRLCDDVARVVRSEDFYADANRRLFGHLLGMHDTSTAIDVTTLVDQLRAAGDLEAIGGEAFLAEVAQSVPYAANATYYAKILKEKAQRRALRLAGEQMVRLAHDLGTPVDKTLTEAEQLIDQAADVRGTAVLDNREGLLATFAAIDAAEQRGRAAETGIHLFDAKYGGLFPTELYILASRPGGGKTTLALTIAEHVAATVPVLFVSAEMTATELDTRRLCMASGVDTHHVRTGSLTGDDRAALVEASAKLQDARLFILDRAEVGIGEIRREARRLKKAHGLGLIVVDYLQLIQPDDRTVVREQQVASMTRRLKITARELEVPVLCACQLNRKAAESEPQLSHLRESGAIEQDADVVMFIHRGDDSDDTNRADLIVAKHRHAATGRIELAWSAAGALGANTHSEFDAWGTP